MSPDKWFFMYEWHCLDEWLQTLIVRRAVTPHAGFGWKAGFSFVRAMLQRVSDSVNDKQSRHFADAVWLEARIEWTNWQLPSAVVRRHGKANISHTGACRKWNWPASKHTAYWLICIGCHDSTKWQRDCAACVCRSLTAAQPTRLSAWDKFRLHACQTVEIQRLMSAIRFVRQSRSWKAVSVKVLPLPKSFTSGIIDNFVDTKAVSWN